MSKLDELLSPERLREINESREDADHRRSVAIATLQEAAKLVCCGCRVGWTLDGECHLGFDDEGNPVDVPCNAAPIHARLAKEKP